MKCDASLVQKSKYCLIFKYLISFFLKCRFKHAACGGKASVPNEVNDLVAPQGSLGQKSYVCKN